MMISCRKKDCNVTEEDGVELHHIIPKFCGGTDKDGRIYLCKKHHDILTKITPTIIFRNVPIEKEQKCREEIKTFTYKWLTK